MGARKSCNVCHFYPRSPCGERLDGSKSSIQEVSFLSTLSLRRATHKKNKSTRQVKHFYPRSPCGERRFDPLETLIILAFLSTLSLRRATTWARGSRVTYVISIHALLAESDRIVKRCQALDIYFYPRSPCGERPPRVVREPTARGFLSTLSLRRATARRESRQQPAGISIHALLAESDSKSAQNSGALLRIWNKFYGDCIFMLTGKAVFYPFCPCFFHIFWCEGTGNFMIAFSSH